ncbi:hypothetical protein HYC85_009729 [Camellia sinensis]|uniref:Uncharacterized protein n=1 Tax=Camellia sinensis TaxID=4442 RepID=A0A7J7HGQ5_CAMSI|nr:hypothetical protein HYC85_009729 [Camellia sinensis]
MTNAIIWSDTGNGVYVRLHDVDAILRDGDTVNNVNDNFVEMLQIEQQAKKPEKNKWFLTNWRKDNKIVHSYKEVSQQWLIWADPPQMGSLSLWIGLSYGLCNLLLPEREGVVPVISSLLASSPRERERASKFDRSSIQLLSEKKKKTKKKNREPKCCPLYQKGVCLLKFGPILFSPNTSGELSSSYCNNQLLCYMDSVAANGYRIYFLADVSSVYLA